jgi:hypothetical protein
MLNPLALEFPEMPQVSRHERFREIHSLAEDLIREDKTLAKDFGRLEKALTQRMKDRKMAMNPAVKLLIKLVLQAILAAL